MMEAGSGGGAMAVASAAVASPGGGTTPRRVFHVKLSVSECTEVDFKALVRQWDELHAAGASVSRAVDTSGNGASDGGSATPEEAVGGLPLTTPRTQRFNIIERLEKRYGGGAVVGPPVQSGHGASQAGGDGDDEGDDDGFRRGDDDDLYDSEDSFIDDSELQQNIEEIHTQARVKTKHSGFFVNAGDEIETIEGAVPVLGIGDDSEIPSNSSTSALKKAKRQKKGGAESSKAVKAFLDEWSDAASEWQPGAEIVEGMEMLRRAVREMTETTPFTKVFPRQLDDALRAVDRLVVDSHPNKWRVNGYFATLMTFLPFTKQYLKSNMLRLEARDTARAAKDELEHAITRIGGGVSSYVTRSETEPLESLRVEITNDKEFALGLHKLIGIQDEWILKENDYRQMLKTEDKKHMKEHEYVQLNARQERNRLFNRVLGLFPPGLIDLQTLRGLSKVAKIKVVRKSSAAVKTATVNKSPATTPKRKLPVVAVAEATSTPAKRSIKPFKSRMMDDAPIFADKDFEEIVD